MTRARPSQSGTPVAASLDDAVLRDIARRIRGHIVRTLHRAGSGHFGGSLSVADLLAALYFRELNLDLEDPERRERDRFILSKGHTAPALYGTLAEKGFIDQAELDTFDEIDSRLQLHPDMLALPYLDMSTGSLGQGLSVGLGFALGARLQARAFRTYVILGDGECQEGQVWETAMVAARYGADNLVAIVDTNRLQQYGWRDAGGDELVRSAPVRDLADKWRAFGWAVIEVDGHDFGEITAAFGQARQTSGRPTAIIAATVKGRGVSFMENDYRWHASAMTEELYKRAIADLGGPA